MERHGIISGKGLLPYLGLTLGIGAVALAVIRVGYMAGAALGCLPILLYIILFAIKNLTGPTPGFLSRTTSSWD